MLRWQLADHVLPSHIPQAWLIDLDDWQDTPHNILKSLIGRSVNANTQPINIRHTPGEPPACLSHPHVHISNAKRGRWVAFALAEQPIGVDVEVIELKKSIPWNVLHPNEQAWIKAGDVPRRFAHVWAGKEAYLKALGIGLNCEPSTVDILQLADYLHFHTAPSKEISACCCLIPNF